MAPKWVQNPKKYLNGRNIKFLLQPKKILEVPNGLQFLEQHF